MEVELLLMAMIDVNRLKVGVSFVDEGTPYRVLKYSFSKIGRGKANVKVKVRNLETGSVVIKSYLSGNAVEKLELVKRELQYLYKDGQSLYFMDPESYEQEEIELAIVGDDVNYLVEGELCWVISWVKDDVSAILGIEVPASVIMEVAETGAAEKGNSATAVLKPAKLASGLVVSVPMFVKVGDKLKINTNSGEYVSRA